MQNEMGKTMDNLMETGVVEGSKYTNNTSTGPLTSVTVTYIGLCGSAGLGFNSFMFRAYSPP